MKPMNGEIPPAEHRNERIMRVWMPTWVKNSVANVERLRGEEHIHSLLELEGAHRGKAAVIVGAGKTLDTVLDNGGDELLKHRGENVILICPNSLTRPILGRGIEPDYWTALHPTHDVAHCWNTEPVTSEPKAIPTAGRKLITVTTIHPQVLDLWLDRDYETGEERNPGEVYLTLQGYDEPMQVVISTEQKENGQREAQVKNISTQKLPGDWYGVAQPAMWNHLDNDPGHIAWPWLKKKKYLPELPNMGCVINYSIQAAVLMGCSPILIVGADYSFMVAEDGRLRFRCDDFRMVDGEWKRQEPDVGQQEVNILSFNMHTVPGIAGKPLHCHEHHISYRNCMQALYDRFKGQDGEQLDIVNCSPDGIVLGLPRMELDVALDRLARGDWWARKDRMPVKPCEIPQEPPAFDTPLVEEVAK